MTGAIPGRGPVDAGIPTAAGPPTAGCTLWCRVRAVSRLTEAEEGHPPPNAGRSTPSPVGSVGGPLKGDASDQGGTVSGEVVGLLAPAAQHGGDR